MKQYQENQRGITLLITLLLMGVLLGISASLLNLTLKQYQLAGIALSSETAFQAANAGLECILYHDFSALDPFAVNADGPPPAQEENSIQCMGVSSGDVADTSDTTVVSGEEQRFRFSWPAASPSVCSEVSIYKFSDATNPINVTVGGKNMRDFDGDGVIDADEQCPAGSVCTVVQARGYNVPCADIGSNPRVVEREYTQVY